MARPNTLEDPLRIYDVAVKTWLRGLVVNYGKSLGFRHIPTVISSPEKAFASAGEVLINEGWFAGASPADVYDKADRPIVPYPWATIWRLDETRNYERANVVRWRNVEVLPNGNLRTHPYPLPYNIMYQIDFFALRKYTAAFIVEWVRSQLGLVGAAQEEMFLSITHARPWGKQLHAFINRGYVDNSQLEMQEFDARVLRRTFTFELIGWKFLPPEGGFDGEGRPRILEVTTDFEDVSKGDPTLSETFPVIGRTTTTRNLMEAAYGNLGPLYEGVKLYLREKGNADVTLSRVGPRASGFARGDSVKCTLPDITSLIESPPLPLPPNKTLLSFDFELLAQQDLLVDLMSVEIDADYNETQVVEKTIPVFASSTWQTVTAYAEIATRHCAFRIRSALVPSTVFYATRPRVMIRKAASDDILVDGDMEAPDTSAWTALGGATLTKWSAGGNQTLRVQTSVVGDGVEQTAPISNLNARVLTVALLQATGTYRVLVGDDVGASSSVVVNSATRQAVVVFKPSYGASNFKVQVAQEGVLSGLIEIDDARLRTYQSPY